ncbi:MAG: Tim44 domain-containing protein [Rhodospirillales bacterium]|nr:Tim44 domain-containing protein [Rhodospirillales bacterium]
MTRTYAILLGLAVAAVLVLAPALAEARAGKGSSSGSRGSRTYQAAPATPTAPQAKPVERSVTPAPAVQPQQAAKPAQAAPAPAAPAPAPMSPGRSFVSGLMGGLIGAGIAGMLFGGGFGGGLGMAGMLGGLLQIALLGGLVFLGVMLFRKMRGAQAPQPAMAGGGNLRERLDHMMGRDAPPASGGGGSASAAPAAVVDEIGIGPNDYQAFEQSLAAVQAAWSNRDVETLRTLVTPEMHDLFTAQLNEDAAKGLSNRVEQVALEQGDLAEAWRENGAEFATVAMRWSALEYTLDPQDRIVEGSASERSQATEVWTFRRDPGASWVLSAIQQIA